MSMHKTFPRRPRDLCPCIKHCVDGHVAKEKRHVLLPRNSKADHSCLCPPPPERKFKTHGQELCVLRIVCGTIPHTSGESMTEVGYQHCGEDERFPTCGSGLPTPWSGNAHSWHASDYTCGPDLRVHITAPAVHLLRAPLPTQQQPQAISSLPKTEPGRRTCGGDEFALALRGVWHLDRAMTERTRVIQRNAAKAAVIMLGNGGGRQENQPSEKRKPRKKLDERVVVGSTTGGPGGRAHDAGQAIRAANSDRLHQ
ncbi:hypothetical protein FN846DRAFT_997349 [Sphaerosporella brunnea]|uniref:Uncharacterized protein n=1 Tax=Sphaerosporella brunnea TaxID=1250544 RepID=A0A5J5EJ79_9PEZI|nr:hypothetical protein FN846DRAFT_997349 [Sphaerosporella brunnea]